MSENKMECKCDQKELCVKMRNAGLKKMICEFEVQPMYDMCINTVNCRLYGIKNALEIYGCMPCQALIKRAEYLIKENGQSEVFSLHSSQQANVKAFIDELKAFVGES